MQVFRRRRNPIIECVLSKYDDPIFIVCLESDSFYGGAQCIQKAMQQCFLQSKANNELVEPVHGLAPVKRVLETFSDDPIIANATLLSSNWTVIPSTRVFWLGYLGFSGSWRHYPYPATSLLGAVQSKHMLNNISSLNLLVNSSRPRHSHYKTDIPLRTDSRFYNNNKNNQSLGLRLTSPLTSLHHPPDIFLQGFLRAGVDWLSAELLAHPYILPALTRGCYDLNDINEKK